MTSPYAFYQYWINVEDASVVSYLKVFTDRSREEIEELERQVREEPFRRAAQRALAADVTTLVHGAAATAAVQAASEALFGKGDPRALDARTLRGRHGRAARWRRSGRDAASSRPSWPAAWSDSRNAARRAIGEGGASVNNVKVSDPEAQLDDD